MKFEPHEISFCRKNLIEWYTSNRRLLPWRGDTVNNIIPPPITPYGIWVSEVMSQQTRIETVIPYWYKWMKQYPTVHELAKADDQEINNLWAGLGYYRRSRMLKAGAQYILDHYDGIIPSHIDELCKIPGIGPYTAGAISSIAYNQPAGIVEGNVIRVFSRLRMIEYTITSKEMTKISWQLANDLVDLEQPGTFNQGLMELGATICTPKLPSCHSCPLQAICYSKYMQDHTTPPSMSSSSSDNISNSLNTASKGKNQSSIKSYLQMKKNIMNSTNTITTNTITSTTDIVENDNTICTIVDIEDMIHIPSPSKSSITTVHVPSKERQLSILFDPQNIPILRDQTTTTGTSNFNNGNSDNNSDEENRIYVTDYPRKIVKKKPRDIVFSVCILRLLSTIPHSNTSTTTTTNTTLSATSHSTSHDKILNEDITTRNNNTVNSVVKYLFVRRPDTGLLASQWEFPNTILYEEESYRTPSKISKASKVAKPSKKNTSKKKGSDKEEIMIVAVENSSICNIEETYDIIEDKGDETTNTYMEIKCSTDTLNNTVQDTLDIEDIDYINEVKPIISKTSLLDQIVPLEDLQYSIHDLMTLFPMYFLTKLGINWISSLTDNINDNNDSNIKESISDDKELSMTPSRHMIDPYIRTQLYSHSDSVTKSVTNTSHTSMKPIIHIFSHERHIYHITIHDVIETNMISMQSSTLSSSSSSSSFYSSSSSELSNASSSNSDSSSNNTNKDKNTSLWKELVYDETRWMTSSELYEQGITTGCKKILHAVENYLSASSSTANIASITDILSSDDNNMSNSSNKKSIMTTTTTTTTTASKKTNRVKKVNTNTKDQDKNDIDEIWDITTNDNISSSSSSSFSFLSSSSLIKKTEKKKRCTSKTVSKVNKKMKSETKQNKPSTTTTTTTKLSSTQVNKTSSQILGNQTILDHHFQVYNFKEYLHVDEDSDDALDHMNNGIKENKSRNKKNISTINTINNDHVSKKVSVIEIFD